MIGFGGKDLGIVKDGRCPAAPGPAARRAERGARDDTCTDERDARGAINAGRKPLDITHRHPRLLTQKRIKSL
jgi:hypothetical protein